MLLDILINLLLGVLGILLTVGLLIRKKIKEDNRLDLKKLIGDNIKFWLTCLGLLIVIVVAIKLEPEVASVINGFISVEDSRGGFFALGILLAGGVDSSPIGKKLAEKPGQSNKIKS